VTKVTKDNDLVTMTALVVAIFVLWHKKLRIPHCFGP
jgi:hypothetical protein